MSDEGWAEIRDEANKKSPEGDNKESCKLAAHKISTSFRWNAQPEGAEFWNYVVCRLNYIGGDRDD